MMTPFPIGTLIRDSRKPSRLNGFRPVPFFILAEYVTRYGNYEARLLDQNFVSIFIPAFWKESPLRELHIAIVNSELL